MTSENVTEVGEPLGHQPAVVRRPRTGPASSSAMMVVMEKPKKGVLVSEPHG
ncbi:hypothetical protein [Streptomyces nitrosporeus]|uniref:hypothetical protein n=1 Tax=Streptomyces nitrosporeus TaxID=28894 RepID=UPI00399F0428